MTATPRAAWRSLAASGLLLLLTGCAAQQAQTTAGDPWEPANRKVYAFNDAIDRAALKPVARAYERNVPKWMRNSVTNFFANLGLPITIVNQLLQGKPVPAGQDTLRFAMNLTLGIGGLFDPASDANLPRHEEDLGQTLGRWGVPPGPYLTLPFLGPSHLRDVPSIVVDRFLEPFYWYSYGNERWISLGLNLLDTRARLLPLDATLERAYDPYAFIRDAYSQRRLFQVYDGDIPEELLAPDDAEFEDDYEDDAGSDMGDESGDAAPQDAPPDDGPPPTGAGTVSAAGYAQAD